MPLPWIALSVRPPPPKPRLVHTRKSKTIFFVLEGLNALSTSYFSSYLFFLLRDRFGFGNLGNLSTSALGGFVYVFAAWQGGRFAQRFGYSRALKTGFGGMAASLLLGAIVPSLPAVLLVFVGWTAAMCFTWPSLEALVSDGVSDDVLPKNIGIYNVVWSATAATASTSSAARSTKRLATTASSGCRRAHPVRPLPDRPAAGQDPRPHGTRGAASGDCPNFCGRTPQKWDCPFGPAIDAKNGTGPPVAAPHPVEAAALAPSFGPQTFLRMVWLAIPFSYIGITTVIAIIPSLAKTLGLSTAQAGLFCSIWMFVRMGTFVVLWQWTGWHYRFRWLLGGVRRAGGRLQPVAPFARHRTAVGRPSDFRHVRRTDLLLLAVLLHGRRRNEGRTWRVARSDDRHGHVSRPRRGALSLYLAPGS